MIEECGKTIREFMRVIKFQIESCAETIVSVDDAIFPWIARWAAMMLSRVKKDKAGKTAYNHLMGKDCATPMIPFGECVWYRKLEGSDLPNLVSRWSEGFWLGHTISSNEMIIGTDDGCVRTWCIKRKPEKSKRWDATLIHSMNGTPEKPNPRKEGDYIPIDIELDSREGARIEHEGHRERPGADEEGGGVPDPRWKRMTVRRAYTARYDYTDGCPACRARENVTKKAHSEKCRNRIKEAMKHDEIGKRWLERERQREEIWG